MKTIVCLPRDARCAYVVPNSTQAHCGECRRPIWLAPSGLAMKDPGDELICVPCCYRRAEREPIALAPMTEWQRREVQAAGIKLETGRGRREPTLLTD